MFRRRRREKRDVSDVLRSWEYDIRQEMMVRRIRGLDNRMKIQMRLDLGLLQMEEQGRPDGKKPHGKESLLDYFESIAGKMKKKYGTSVDFTLDKDDCYALQQEGIQYYYRYLCFFQIGDYKQAERDTARNLRLFDFIKRYAAEEQYNEDFEQYRPYVMMMNTRARVLGALKTKDVTRAVSEINNGIHSIESVYKAAPGSSSASNGSSASSRTEITFLKNWAEEIVKRYKPSRRQRLVEELQDAVKNEEYERAARLRDKLNRLEE